MASPRTIEDVVCPFCSLACDDLVIEAEGASLRVARAGCSIAAREFAAVPGDGQPLVAGQPATLDEATARAAEILAKARLPLYGGLGTDLAGMRAVLGLAERTGGVVDHAGSGGLLANVRATQDGGWVTTTLAEVRNRADLVLFVGTDAGTMAPRLVERCLLPRAGLFGPLARELIYLGQGLEPAAGVGPVTVVDCPPARLASVLAELRACVAAPARSGGELAEVAARLRRARYPVVVWAAAQFPGGHADLLVGAIAGLLRELNATGRCAGLPLAGPDNVVGANQVCAWQTGVPLRTSFAAGAPDHDPVRWNGAGLLASGMVDALLWLGSLRELPVPEVRPPTVALVRPNTVPVRPVEVLVPVGVPGLDHAGSLFRTDNVVAVPVRALRDTALPAAAEVLGRIAARLDA